jgi:hypothetical protein
VFNLRQTAVSLIGQHSDSGAILDFAMDGKFLYAARGPVLPIANRG